METVKAYKVVNNVNGELVSALAGNKKYWYEFQPMGTQKTYNKDKFTICKKEPMGVFRKLNDARDFCRKEGVYY